MIPFDKQIKDAQNFKTWQTNPKLKLLQLLLVLIHIDNHIEDAHGFKTWPKKHVLLQSGCQKELIVTIIVVISISEIVWRFYFQMNFMGLFILVANHALIIAFFAVIWFSETVSRFYFQMNFMWLFISVAKMH